MHYMRKKSQNSVDRISSGFNDLMGSYIEALQENSADIAEMLTSLKGRELSKDEKKELGEIKKSIKKIDSNLKFLDGR